MTSIRWIKSYNEAMRSPADLFLAASQHAKEEIRERIVVIECSRTEDEKREYAALLLALADLNVLVSSFWNKQSRGTITAPQFSE